MSVAAATAEPPRANEAEGRVVVVFGGLMLVMLLAALDQTIVSTALPTIVGDLGGLNHISWVVTAYLLAQTVVTPLYGKLGDLYGRKVVLHVALVIFLAGSALCGLSQNFTELVAFRALQGLGGGGLMVSAQAAIGDVVGPRERGRYQGLFGAVFALATVIGPLLGGFLTTHLSWRWIFYVNLPLGVLAFVVLGATLPARSERLHRKVDYLGTVLLGAGLSAIILATTLGGTTYAWASPQIIGLGAAAVVLLALFIPAERRAAEPVLPLELFSNAVFSVSSAIGLIIGFALFGSVVFIPLFLQIVLGASPTGSGLQLLPLMGGLLVTSIASGQIITRTGRYKPFPIAGTAIAAVGLYLLSRMGIHTQTLTASLYMVILGLGLGMVMQVLVLAVQNSVGYEQLGVATAGATMFRSIGGSLGTAVLGAIFSNRLQTALTTVLPRSAGSVSRLTSGQANPAQIKQLPAALHTAYLGAFVHSLSTVFVVAAVITLASFFFSWFLRESPLRSTVAASGVGEAFAVPKHGDSLREIARALSVLAGRERSRLFLERVVAEAGLDLPPAAAWVLIRLGDPECLGMEDLEARLRDPALLRSSVQELRRRGLLEPAAEEHARPELTDTGRALREQLVEVARGRLTELLSGWSPEQYDELAALLKRLAGDLVGSTPRGAGAPREPAAVGV